MDRRSSTGLLAVVTIGGLAIAGLWGLVEGYVTGNPDTLLAPTIVTAAITIVVVATLVVVGTRSARRRQNPYW